MSRSLGWKGAALMPAAAVLVHQLRYALAYGPGARHALIEQGHGYLSSVTPWIVLLAAAAVGGVVGSFAQALRGRAHARETGASALGVWLFASLALIAIYCGQELLEGFFATGHPGGLGGVFGGGGWWAIPAAHLVALALTLLLRGADAVVARIARRRREVPARVPVVTVPAGGVSPLSKLAPLASASAGRAPPRIALQL
jgi:hypothetical protein